jgi:hypothetical protein
VIEWGRVPWPLWVYVAVGLAAVVGNAIQKSTRASLAIPAILFLLMWDIGLLRGIRWVWMLVIGVNVLFLAVNLIFGPRAWYDIVIYVVFPLLLLHPLTRKFFAREPAADT